MVFGGGIGCSGGFDVAVGYVNDAGFLDDDAADGGFWAISVGGEDVDDVADADHSGDALDGGFKGEGDVAFAFFDEEGGACNFGAGFYFAG